jgi:hypothetical protein
MPAMLEYLFILAIFEFDWAETGCASFGSTSCQRRYHLNAPTFVSGLNQHLFYYRSTRVCFQAADLELGVMSRSHNR